MIYSGPATVTASKQLAQLMQLHTLMTTLVVLLSCSCVLVTVAPAGRRIRQLRSTTLATKAALQRVATLTSTLVP